MLKKQDSKKKPKKTKKTLIIFLAVVSLLLSGFLLYNLYFLQSIFPGIYLANFSVSGLKPNPTDASYLASKIKAPEALNLTDGAQNWSIPLADIDFKYNYSGSLQKAYFEDRSGNLFWDFSHRALAPFRKKKLGLDFSFDKNKLDLNISTIAEIIASEPVYPSAKIKGKDITINKGSAGFELDRQKLVSQIENSFRYNLDSPLTLPLNKIDPSISDQQAQIFKERLAAVIDRNLVLKFEDRSFNLKNNDLVELFIAKGGYSQEKIAALAAKIALEVNRDPQNSVFVFQDGKVEEFTPSKDGVRVIEESLVNSIEGNLASLEFGPDKTISIDIPVSLTPPKIKIEDVNNMGIKELLGHGSSRFLGSIPNRIYNINLAASRFKGVLVAPGETFSFNDILGDVSSLTGYKQAYVIKDGKTILGDGGGVCQVSTTLFRAILKAGLPITERRAHSYRVGYYEQDSPPGLDATVYAPTADLKFKNDTPGHLLIQSSVNSKTATLTFDLYGTADGRVATTSKPIVSEVTPPPEDLYVDDPALPVGTTKQIDYKAWGAKVTFKYLVKRADEIITDKTFVSNYRPWQAVYLRGTGPAQ